MPDEHTIADNLQRLKDVKTAIGDAITLKGGTVAADDGEDAVDVIPCRYTYEESDVPIDSVDDNESKQLTE